MDNLSALFAADGGAGGTLLFLLVVGVSVTLAAFGISMLVSGATDPVRRRVAMATTPQQAGGQPSRRHDFSRFIDPLAKYILPSKSAEKDSVQRHLIHAGFRSPNALRHFYGLKALLALGLPLVVFFSLRWAPNVTTNMLVILVLLGAMIGVRLPDMVLSRLRTQRIKRLRNGFPDALDLLVVCVESGLGLVPAIERVAREIEISHSELAQELALVNAEIRAGVERRVALRNLSDRTGVEDINGLVGLLIQTIRFGTSVADALRVYSEEFRDKRMQRAEEQAAKIGTKMIFPLVFCFFPSFFIVAVGPAVMRIVAGFQGMAG